ASRKASPRVRGTNRKWYIAVMANCRRDRSTTVSEIISAPPRWGKELRLRCGAEQTFADSLATVDRHGWLGEPDRLDGEQDGQLDQQDDADLANQGDAPGGLRRGMRHDGAPETACTGG